MQSMLITIVAMDLDEPVAECQGEIDLETFEVTELTDQSFVNAPSNLYEGFGISIDDKIYPLAVDFMDTGNEFMVMDADGIDAVNRHADANPTEIEGEPEPVDFDDDGDFGEDD